MKLVRSKILECSETPSKIIEENIDEVHHIAENQQQTSVRSVAMACSIFRTTAHRIMIALKHYKAQFVQET